MLKKVLLLFAVILFTGCVERGYNLTINNQTNTVTAIKSVDIRTKATTTTKADIEKMNTAIYKQPQAKQSTVDKPSKKQNEKLEKELADKKKPEETLEEEKQAREAKNKLEDEQLKSAQERKTLEEKLAAEKEEMQRKAEALQKIKSTKEKKLAKEKRVAALKQQEAERKAEKLRLAKEAQMRAQKEEARKKALAKKKPLATTEALIFKPSSQTYQKFGTSEIHGHVVYLTPSGQEINLQNTKIYLVPKNTKTDYWYNNYYLKNKEASSLSKTVVHYMNATHLNVEKNFAFYGLPTGVYYVIIESNYPPSVVKNKKVYIAKKINVEKYKKIMTIFSKKL